jgi:hypothetical protein
LHLIAFLLVLIGVMIFAPLALLNSRTSKWHFCIVYPIKYITNGIFS